MTPRYPPLSSDGTTVTWSPWAEDSIETLTLRWQNEAWTAEGVVEREQVHYVIRLSADFRAQQFLLFRDLDEPDLWLATDGAGRWGEVNGAHRTDLDGCTGILLGCTPFTHTLSVRHLPLLDGHAARITVARVDVETLGIESVAVEYTRVDERRWQWRTDEPGAIHVEFTVDEHGLVVDEEGRYRRLARSSSHAPNSAP